MKEKKQINVQIGGRIRIAREAAGYTQEHFAELIECFRSIYSSEPGTWCSRYFLLPCQDM